MLISTVISLIYNETSFTPLLISSSACILLGLLPVVLIEKIHEVKFHEGLAISVIGWFVTCFTGLFPFYLWGGEFTFTNALFESVSGYTTTGASILIDVEALPKGLLFWRSSTSFVGGLGIILFVLLILPEKIEMRSYIYRAEVSTLSKMNFISRLRIVLRVVMSVYLILIITETFILTFLGMSLFDSICHSFSTVATSGFSNKNLSISAYNNVWIEVVVIVFMLISSMHFGLIYGAFTGKKNSIFNSHVTSMYVFVLFIGVVLITMQLFNDKVYSFWESVRHAAFQVVSHASTTGFATTDSANWPIFSVILLLYFSVQCGMVGSTAGGIKFDRIYIYFALLKNQIKMVLHPEGVYATKIDNQIVNHSLQLQISVFIVIYIVTIVVSTLLLAALGVDGITSLSSSIATLGNVGPGFGSVSSLSNYSQLPDSAKYILSANMLFGRLEIMNILALALLIVRKRER